jgi:hypothetical protein
MHLAVQNMRLGVQNMHLEVQIMHLAVQIMQLDLQIIPPLYVDFPTIPSHSGLFWRNYTPLALLNVSAAHLEARIIEDLQIRIFCDSAGIK